MASIGPLFVIGHWDIERSLALIQACSCTKWCSCTRLIGLDQVFGSSPSLSCLPQYRDSLGIPSSISRFHCNNAEINKEDGRQLCTPHRRPAPSPNDPHAKEAMKLHCEDGGQARAHTHSAQRVDRAQAYRKLVCRWPEPCASLCPFFFCSAPVPLSLAPSSAWTVSSSLPAQLSLLLLPHSTPGLQAQRRRAQETGW